MGATRPPNGVVPRLTKGDSKGASVASRAQDTDGSTPNGNRVVVPATKLRPASSDRRCRRTVRRFVPLVAEANTSVVAVSSRLVPVPPLLLRTVLLSPATGASMLASPGTEPGSIHSAARNSLRSDASWAERCRTAAARSPPSSVPSWSSRARSAVAASAEAASSSGA